jgi:hypothetical protein
MDMSTQVVEALSRHAAGISRRASLMSLGAAGIVALANPLTGEARKSGKKNRKKCKSKTSQQEEDRCPGQVEPCTDFLDTFCGGRPECLDHSACCAFLETCEVNTFLTCLINQA